MAKKVVTFEYVRGCGVGEFFKNDYDPKLDRSRLINEWAESNYQTAISHGVDPLTAMDWGTDAAVVWAKFAIDPDYKPSETERNHLRRFWVDLLG